MANNPIIKSSQNPFDSNFLRCEEITPSVSRSNAPTITPTPTTTPSNTPNISFTPTPSVTPTISVTPTHSYSASIPIPSLTPSVSPSLTQSPSTSLLISVSVTPTITYSITPTISITPSVSITITPSVTPTSTVSLTPSITPTLSVTPSVSFEPIIISGSLNTAFINIPYSRGLTVSGGISPYTWDINGLNGDFTYDTTTGVISGTATQIIDLPLIIMITDQSNNTYSFEYIFVCTDRAAIHLNFENGYENIGTEPITFTPRDDATITDINPISGLYSFNPDPNNTKNGSTYLISDQIMGDLLSRGSFTIKIKFKLIDGVNLTGETTIIGSYNSGGTSPYSFYIGILNQTQFFFYTNNSTNYFDIPFVLSPNVTYSLIVTQTTLNTLRMYLDDNLLDEFIINNRPFISPSPLIIGGPILPITSGDIGFGNNLLDDILIYDVLMYDVDRPDPATP